MFMVYPNSGSGDQKPETQSTPRLKVSISGKSLHWLYVQRPNSAWPHSARFVAINLANPSTSLSPAADRTGFSGIQPTVIPLQLWIHPSMPF